MSIKEKLSNLHLLLGVPSFARLPLDVRFFSEDVYQAWLKWSHSAGCNIGSGITVSLSATGVTESCLRICDQPKANQGKDFVCGGIESIPVNYAPFKDYVEKSLFILSEGELVDCVVCNGPITTPTAMALVCHEKSCRAVSHVACLANRFTSNGKEQNLLPTTGKCPKCSAELSWARLVTEMTLRMRGEKEVVQLMKKARQKRSKACKPKDIDLINGSSEDNHSELQDDLDEDDEYMDLSIAEVVDEPLMDEARYGTPSDEEDAMSVTSVGSDMSHMSHTSRGGNPSKTGSHASRLEIVIENSSDWDDAEVLD
ncbi:Slx4p interacting protein [Lambiella insularis]|nr:Slx4p interacting protein [Lambiella insularis]